MTPAGHVAFACKAIAAPVANTEPSRGASSPTAVHGEVLACTVTPSVFDVNVVVVPLIRTLARNWCVPSAAVVVAKSALVAVLKFWNVVNDPLVPVRCCHWISGVPKLQLANAVRWMGVPRTTELGPKIAIVQLGVHDSTVSVTEPVATRPAGSVSV